MCPNEIQRPNGRLTVKIVGSEVDRLALWLRCSVPARVQVYSEQPASGESIVECTSSEAAAELHADDLPDVDKASRIPLLTSAFYAFFVQYRIEEKRLECSSGPNWTPL